MQKLKKGTYYVGDPRHIFEKSWDKVLSDTLYFGQYVGRFSQYKDKDIRRSNEISKVFGQECFVSKTAYGDGVYTDNSGREYYVDAGFIGVLPISLILIDNEYTLDEIKENEGMHIIEFDSDFFVDCDRGLFEFGSIIIDTN